MSMRRNWSWCAALAMAVMFLLQAGCEVTAKKDQVTVDPGSSTLIRDQSVTLTANGADDFVWSLENDAWGTLSPRRGRTVVYTSRHAPPAGQTVVQKVTAVGEIIGASSNQTRATGVAYVTHLSGSISVAPSAATLRQGQSVTLRASGGGTYTWTLENGSYGVLSKSVGNPVQYTSQYAAPDGKAVVQKITVTSDNGGSTVVLITQQPGGIISIAPSTTTLQNGMDQLFTVSGGSEYSYSVSQPSWGIITVLGPGTFRYTSTRVTPPGSTETVTITVTDISSAKATATVYNVP